MLEVPAAEGEGAKVLVDRLEERLCALVAERVLRRLLGREGVVRACALLDDAAAAGRAERLNGKVLALLHARRVLAVAVLLDDRHALALDAVVATVDDIRPDRVAVEVRDGLDWRVSERYSSSNSPWWVLPPTSTS